MYDFLLVCRCNYSYTVYELFDVENIVKLKSRLGITEGRWTWHQQ